jgi:hypothetical protein
MGEMAVSLMLSAAKTGRTRWRIWKRLQLFLLALPAARDENGQDGSCDPIFWVTLAEMEGIKMAATPHKVAAGKEGDYPHILYQLTKMMWSRWQLF